MIWLIKCTFENKYFFLKSSEIVDFHNNIIYLEKKKKKNPKFLVTTWLNEFVFSTSLTLLFWSLKNPQWHLKPNKRVHLHWYRLSYLPIDTCSWTMCLHHTSSHHTLWLPWWWTPILNPNIYIYIYIMLQTPFCDINV